MCKVVCCFHLHQDRVNKLLTNDCIHRVISCFVCTSLGMGGWEQGRLASQAATLLGVHPGLLGAAQGAGVPAALQHLLRPRRWASSLFRSVQNLHVI